MKQPCIFVSGCRAKENLLIFSTVIILNFHTSTTCLFMYSCFKIDQGGKFVGLERVPGVLGTSGTIVICRICGILKLMMQIMLCFYLLLS